MPISVALYREGHLAILKGNLAEDGAVAKITGLKSPAITGPARVFDDEQSAMEAILSDRIRPGDVVVLRYLGPQGGPGMPEMLAPTSALVGRGLGESVGLITDGRFSGGTYCLWYPMKKGAPIADFHEALKDLEIPKMLCAELTVKSDRETAGLNGSGLVIVNPPYVLKDELHALLPVLKEKLAQDRYASQRAFWLRGEE